MRYILGALKFIFGLVLGFVLAVSATVVFAAGRDGSGNYTLYTPGNPVVTNTTISSSWANGTLNDIKTALTDSLSRSGLGGMLAPLRLTDGVAGTPSLAFGTETTTGIYRAGANDMRLVVGAIERQKWTASTSTMTGTGTAAALTATGGTGAAAAGAVFQPADLVTPTGPNIRLPILTAAPSTLTNGDFWLTSAGAFARIGGATIRVGGAEYFASYKRISNQATVTATATIVNFDTLVFDIPSVDVTTGAAWKFTTPTDGTGDYLVTTSIAVETALPSWAETVVALYKGGVFQSNLDIWQTTLNAHTQMKGSSIIRLAAGEYVDIRFTQNSGAGANICAAAYPCYIQLHRL